MANSKRSVYLTDEEIIALYWKRNERAIEETDAKYHGYLHTVAYNILHDDLDCEECLNDTYLGTWNAIPPARPSVFQIFLSKILRNTAVNRYKRNHATKRIPSEMTVSLEELEPYFAYREYTSTVEADYETYQLSLLLSRYLRSLTEKQSFIFICRYYCCDRIADIADMLHVSERTVFRTLKTLQQGLKALLEKEGYRYE